MFDLVSLDCVSNTYFVYCIQHTHLLFPCDICQTSILKIYIFK